MVVPPKVDDLGLKILFLLIPGIMSVGLLKSIGPKRPQSDFESGLQIFIYGVTSYAIAGLIEGAFVWFHEPTPHQSLFKIIVSNSLGLATLSGEKILGTDQIFFATIVSLALGLTVSVIQNHSVPHRILRALGLTKRTNEVDIWELTLNSPSIDQWVTVRHHENNLIYQGWVRGYSDGGDERELLLAEVTVYAFDEESASLAPVDEIPIIYLGLDRKNAILELREARRVAVTGEEKWLAIAKRLFT